MTDAADSQVIIGALSCQPTRENVVAWCRHGAITPDWFCPEYWGEQAVPVTAGGRGGAWFIAQGDHQWVLRHYRRGGLMAKLSTSRFLYTGESRVRSLAEFKLLRQLHEAGLPVPAPVAAGYQRLGISYRAAILLERLPGVQPFGSLAGQCDEQVWRAVGQTIRRFHDAGVYHADLNCFNVLVADPTIYLIDFDKGRLKSPGAEGWKHRNLQRLKRSLLKLECFASEALDLDARWGALRGGYEQG